MRTLHDLPPSLIDAHEPGLPAGGGLLIALAGSMMFWGVVAWAFL